MAPLTKLKFSAIIFCSDRVHFNGIQDESLVKRVYPKESLP